MSIRQLSLVFLSFIAPSVLFAADAASDSSATTGQQGGGFGPIIFLVAILAFMYFLVWRPQQKKAKQHRALVAAITAGDEVLLSSGMVGKIVETYEQYVSISLQDGVTVLLQRGAVAAVLPKGTIESLKKTAK